mmetsp:Transcript_31719/g.48598  ORF Transcript_31719/g.48598 Transcript_31719/m.48598 type:complete len:130 (+) Transcript_31719:2322-2711(+)
MEIRQKQQAHQKQNEATNLEKDRFQNDINAQMQKMDRVQQQYGSSLDNVKQVRGEGFDESRENVEIQGLVENEKTVHLLNALAVIVNEFPALGNVIKSSFGEDMQIPSRPQSAIERPVTQSSHRSQQQM